MPNPLIDEEGLVLVAGRLLAWKVARLRLGGFAGQWSPTIYGAHDLATCNRNPGHVAPHPGCACGFYAVRHRAAAIRRLEPDVPALLEVELAGRFDEYERGYVAAVQHVVRATVVQACSQCLLERRLKPAILLGDVGGGAETFGIEPVCAEHADARDLVSSPASAAHLVGIELQWEPLTGQVLRHLQTLAQLRGHRAGSRYVSELAAGEVGHVYDQEVAADKSGCWWVNSDARLLTQVTPIDVPVHRAQDGRLEVFLDGLEEPTDGWRNPTARHSMTARAVGELLPQLDQYESRASRSRETWRGRGGR